MKNAPTIDFKKEIPVIILFAGLGAVLSNVFVSVDVAAYPYKTLMPSILLLAFVIAAVLIYLFAIKVEWLREHKELMTVGLLSTFTSVVFAFMFKGIPFGINGITGDSGFTTAMVQKFTQYWSLKDFNYDGLSAFYPPLYPYILGKIGLFFNIEGYRMVKYGALASAFMLPLIVFYLWRFIADKMLGLVVTILTVVVFYPIEFLNKSFEVWSVVLFLPWMLIFLENVKGYVFDDRRSYIYFCVIGGIVGGLIFQTYYYWFFVLAVFFFLQLLAAWVAPEEGTLIKEKVKRYFYVLGFSALFSINYWGPLAFDILKHGAEPLQNRWFRVEYLTIPTYTNINIINLVLLSGLCFVAFTAMKVKINRTILVFILASYLWHFIGYFAIIADKPLLSFKVNILINELLIIAGGYAIHYLFAKFRDKQNIAVLLFAIILFMIGGQSVINLQYNDMYATAAKTTIPTGTLDNVKKLSEYEGKVFLTDQFVINKYLPVYYFINENAHYAHPASLYSDRIEFLRETSAITDTKLLNWLLRYNKFGRIDYIYLPSGELYISHDNFPNENPYNTVHIKFSPNFMTGEHLRPTGSANIFKVKEIEFDAVYGFNSEQLALIYKYSNVDKEKIKKATSDEK